MRTLNERQAEVQAMPTEELQRKYLAGGFGELRPFVFAELSARKSAEESSRLARSEIREDDSLSISRKALHNSKWANIIAIIAIALSITTAIAVAVISVKFGK